LNSFELNKIAGACLGTLLLAMWLNVISGAIYGHAKLSKPAYFLATAQEVAGDGNGAPTQSIAPVDQRLAVADVKKGEADTKPCQACHNFEKGAGTKIGPPLYGVVDRPQGSVAGFEYSDAIKSKAGKWTYADLDQFLNNPKAYAQGTKMAFAGEPNPAKRADLIDYLHTLSDSPEPLPASGQAGAGPGHGDSTKTPLPQPKEHTGSDNPKPLPASRAAPAPGGTSTGPALPRPKEHAIEPRQAHPPKLASRTRK
jgi:cytochrome c